MGLGGAALAASAAGALASGLSSASNNRPSGNTTTTTVNPTAQAQLPFLQGLWQNTNTLGNSGVNFNAPGFEQVAGFTPQQTQALNLQAQRAQSGSPVNNAAQGYATNLLNGNLLSAGNPYFSNMSDQILSKVLPGIESTFAGGNRVNSPGAAFSAAQGATSALAPYAYQNYHDTLGLMNQESFNAPNLANQDYLDIGNLYNAGGASQAQQQQYINEAINNYNRNQQAPWQLLNSMSGLFGNPVGGSTSTTSPFFTNPFANAAGGAGAGLSLFNGINNASGNSGNSGNGTMPNYTGLLASAASNVNNPAYASAFGTPGQ